MPVCASAHRTFLWSAPSIVQWLTCNRIPIGKVKSATPKVDKAEKPKTPKGRGYKRAVYTRRFVNVTMTGGKRRVCFATRGEVKKGRSGRLTVTADEPEPDVVRMVVV